MGFFNVFCGYLWFDGVGVIFFDVKMMVIVKVGDYKGIYSFLMVE